MADGNPTAAFERKVIIALESTMSGVQDTIRALESMRKHLGHTETSTKSVDKATAALSRTYSKASKDVAKLGGKFKSLKKIQKGMYETMRSVGNVTRVSLGTATVAAGAFIAETKRIGDTMLDFQVSSLNAAKSLGVLENAYGSLRAQSNNAVLSMQDVASEITKFQKQGIAQMSATMGKGFIEGWANIQGAITSVVGKSKASETMNEWVGSLGDEFGFLRKTIAKELGPIAKQIQNATTTEFKVESINRAIKKLHEMYTRTGDLGGVTQQLIGHFKTMKQVAEGSASPLIAGTVAINNAMTKIGTTIENVSTRLVEAFGPEIKTIVFGLGNWLENNVTRVIDNLITKAKELHARFEAWGGTTKLIESLTRALDAAWAVISKITVAGLNFIEWITNANAATQVLAAGIASLVLAPGLIPAIYTVGIGLGGVTQAAYSAAVALKSMSLAGMAGFAGKLGIVGAAATVGHLGGKALGGFDPGTFGDALSGAAGAAVTGAMIGSVVPGIGTAVGAAIGGVGSLIVTAIGSWGDDTEEAMKKIQPPEIPAFVTQEMKRLREEVDRIQAENLERIAKETKKAGEEAEKTGNKFADFVLRVKDLEQLSKRILPGFAQAVGGISAIVDTLGPTTDQFGESISDLIKRTSMDEMTHGFDSVQKYAKLAAEQIALIDLARARKDFDAVEQHTRLLGLALADVEKGTGNLKQALEGALKPLEKQVELISAIKDLRQLDLDISQQLYGTPALAVQAQLELVKTMQMQKETLEAQLATTQSIIAQQLAQGRTEKDIFFLRMKELALSKEIKSVTRDQLRQVKELRDGYLSAVTASALGASRFSKVLITQDQNLMRGLLKGAVKPNFLLGQAGAAAGANRADPYRFSAQGMGYLETLGGGIMTPDDISKAVSERVSNISDPMARDAAAQSAELFTNIMGGANKNTRDLGNIFMLGSDRQVDAINALAEKLHPASATALALAGTAAGETVTGAAADRFGRGKNLPPLTNADYRKQAQQQGSAAASIEAFIKYRQAPAARNFEGPAGAGAAALYADMMKSLEIQTQIPGAKGKKKEKLEGDLDKTRNAIEFRSGALRSVFGDAGFKAVGDALKLFDQTVTDKAAIKVDMLTDQISKLLGGDVDPKVRSKILQFGQERTDLIEDFDFGSVNRVKEADMIKKSRKTNEEQMKKVEQLKKSAPSETEQMIKRYSHPALGGMPTLTAVDTDEFMGRKKATQGLTRKYGARSGFIGRKLEVISKLDKKLKKIREQTEPAAWKGVPYAIPDNGKEPMGPPTKQEDRARRKKEREGKRQYKLMRSKKTLEKARKREFDALDRVREAVDGPGRRRAEQEEQERKIQAAAHEAFGTGYTGAAPERVPVFKPKIPPSTGPQSPENVRGKQTPIKARVGVSDPGRVRQLGHGAGGAGGNWQAKGKGVKQILAQAGQIIQDMGQEMDRFNEDQDNITEYAGNRLFNVQAVSPT